MAAPDVVRITLCRGLLPVHAEGTLEVRYSSDVPWDPDARPVEVRLALDVDAMTPSTLQRFPWARWLSFADSYWRTHDNDPDDAHVRVAIRTFNAERGRPNTGRPGRRGHPPEHYAGVATRYHQLRAEGASNPTTRLAAERHVSRSTAAGWVSEARRRGFLPPARPNRAG